MTVYAIRSHENPQSPDSLFTSITKDLLGIKRKKCHIVKDMWYTRWHAFGDWGRGLSEKKLLKSS